MAGRTTCPLFGGVPLYGYQYGGHSVHVVLILSNLQVVHKACSGMPIALILSNLQVVHKACSGMPNPIALI